MTAGSLLWCQGVLVPDPDGLCGASRAAEAAVCQYSAGAPLFRPPPLWGPGPGPDDPGGAALRWG